MQYNFQQPNSEDIFSFQSSARGNFFQAQQQQEQYNQYQSSQQQQQQYMQQQQQQQMQQQQQQQLQQQQQQQMQQQFQQFQQYTPYQQTNFQSSFSPLNTYTSIPNAISTASTLNTNSNINYFLPNNVQETRGNRYEIEDIICQAYIKQQESTYIPPQELIKRGGRNNSSVALYDFKGKILESMGSLDGGRQVNPEDDADQEEVPFEYEEICLKKNERYGEVRNIHLQQQCNTLDGKYYQEDHRYSRNLMSRSSASLKRVDKIQEKVQNILSHKREKSEINDYKVLQNKQDNVNTFFSSFEQGRIQNEMMDASNENMNIVVKQSMIKSPVSERRNYKQKMFQFGDIKKQIMFEPKEVVLDLGKKNEKCQTSYSNLRTSNNDCNQKTEYFHIGSHQNDSNSALFLKRKESTNVLSYQPSNGATNNHRLAMSPAKKKISINKLCKTPTPCIKQKTLDLQDTFYTPHKKRDTSKGHLSINNSPFPENSVLKQKAINAQHITSNGRNIPQENQKFNQNQDAQKLPNSSTAENIPKLLNQNDKNRPFTGIKANQKSPQGIKLNAISNGVSSSVHTNTNNNNDLFDSQISLSMYRLESELGKGSYASVKVGIEKSSGETFALKIYQKSTLTDPNKMRNVRREIQILRKLSHQNIIRMPYAFNEKSQIILVMECFSKQSLHAFLKKQEQRRVSENEAKVIFRQIVDGINYCHTRGIVHRDIKIENILIQEQQRQIKVIDFGFSICSATKLKVFCGTPAYMAPEIVSKIEYCGKKADVWALGIVLYVLLCGKFPFKGNTDSELFKKIRGCQYETPAFLSEKCVKLFKKILRQSSNERPDCSEILQDEWLAI